MTSDDKRRAHEHAVKTRKYHPSRIRHAGHEFYEVPMRLPKQIEAIDRLVVGYRLAGLDVGRVALLTNITRLEVLKVLKVWGSEYGGVFVAFPEYLHLLVPDYLPCQSPDFKQIQKDLIEEAERAGREECARRKLAVPRKRRAKRRPL